MNNLVNPDGTIVTVQGNDLPHCKGVEGANNYPTRPNSRIAVFDEELEQVYVIKTDINNNKINIRRFDLIENPIPGPDDIYVKKEDFLIMEDKINNVQQSISKLSELFTAFATNATANQSSTGNEQHAANAKFSKSIQSHNKQQKSSGNVNSND